MSRVTIDYYGVTASGSNVTEAKRAAGAILQTIVSEHGRVYLHRFGRISCILWFSHCGWTYTFLDSGTMPGAIFGCSTYPTRQETMTRAAYHAAQNDWNMADGVKVPDYITDHNERADMERWQRWQLHYRYLRNHGMNDAEAHSAARFDWNPEMASAAA